MARRLSIIDVAAIAIIILSVAVLAFVGFSIWAELGCAEASATPSRAPRRTAALSGFFNLSHVFDGR
jgi:hypothetical protein